MKKRGLLFTKRIPVGYVEKESSGYISRLIKSGCQVKARINELWIGGDYDTTARARMTVTFNH
jgi:hypothetical protein